MTNNNTTPFIAKLSTIDTNGEVWIWDTKPTFEITSTTVADWSYTTPSNGGIGRLIYKAEPVSIDISRGSLKPIRQVGEQA